MVITLIFLSYFRQSQFAASVVCAIFVSQRTWRRNLMSWEFCRMAFPSAVLFLFRMLLWSSNMKREVMAIHGPNRTTLHSFCKVDSGPVSTTGAPEAVAFRWNPNSCQNQRRFRQASPGCLAFHCTLDASQQTNSIFNWKRWRQSGRNEFYAQPWVEI